jgi:glutamate-1-semialdehyde 2,1-aminomutase
MSSKIVVGTTTHPANDAIEALCKRLNVECYRHPDENDVVSRMNVLASRYNPQYLMRISGDCPLLDTFIAARALRCLRRYGRELFLYYLPSFTWPVYGAREFPMARTAWNKIAQGATGDEREHPDLWLNRNRDRFNVLYHQGPSNWYYAHPDKVRTELDWPEDLELIKAVAERGPGLLAPLVNLQNHESDIMTWLGRYEQYCINARLHKERTGPTVSYTNQEESRWRRFMMRADFVITWEDQELRKPGEAERTIQVFCDSGQCLLGWGVNGTLHMVDGGIIHHAGRLACECGAGGKWWKKIEKEY